MPATHTSAFAWPQLSAGSLHFRLFAIAIRDGATLEEACEATRSRGTDGWDLETSRLMLDVIRRDPPGPLTYDLSPFEPRKEPIMAAAAKKQDGEGAGISGEYKRPDAAKAFEIFDKQIKPKQAKLSELKGDLSQPYDDIKEQANFPRKVLDFIISLEGLEDAKRDHFLLALSGGLAHRKLFLPRDLVTIAQGEDGSSVIPIGSGRKPQLATLPMGIPSDGSETDLADAGDPDGDDDDGANDDSSDGDDFEASEEELAAQQGRPGNEPAEEEPAYGTDAAALKGMSRRSRKEVPAE